MEYKYPYIANKDMYAAVMGACAWIREDGYFNKAVDYYAKKHNVDKDALAKEIRKRQSAGQVNKKRGNYKYYIVQKHCSSCEGSSNTIVNTRIVKALNSSNACTNYKNHDTGSYYDLDYYDIAIEEFDTKKEAEHYIKTIK